MTLATHAEPDRAFLAEIERYLADFGLKVTKARTTGATSTARADGATPATVRSAKHAGCAAHWRVPGFSKPVCIAPEGARIEGGDELVGPEWTDTDTVLAFAADVGARVADAGRVLTTARKREAARIEAERA